MYGIKCYLEEKGNIRPAERCEEKFLAVDIDFAERSRNHRTQRPTFASADALLEACLYAVVVVDCGPRRVRTVRVVSVLTTAQ